MRLILRRLPPQRGPTGDGYRGQVPSRALQMHPDAAVAFLQVVADLGGDLVCTDIYRSPEEVLRAKTAKPRITKGVGYSYHGVGGCVDQDTEATLANTNISYDDISSIWADHGFHCHRRDGDPNGSESWHFNFYGNKAADYLKLADPHNHATWDLPAEAAIQDLYGPELILTPEQVESQLTDIGYDLGIGTINCIKSFQRQWLLTPDGVAGDVTQRTLAFVAAQIVFV